MDDGNCLGWNYIAMASADSSKNRIMKCCCCHDICWNIEKDLIQCACCKRAYHKQCYCADLLNIDNFSSFTCVMCIDIKKCIADSQKRNLPFGLNEKKIIFRMLLELYIRAENTEFIKWCPNPQMYSDYYEKITNPMSLGNIKQFLEKDEYSEVIYAIVDMKRTFMNAMTFFVPNDPYHNIAKELHIFLFKMIEELLPSLIHDINEIYDNIDW